MKLWKFEDPCDDRYARAGRRGTWTESRGTCGECGASTQRRIPPLVIEWEPDSDVVGDFVWPGFGDDIAVTRRVVEALEKRSPTFEPGPVEMVQDPHLSKKTQRESRVWLPYEGPPLYDLRVNHWVGVDRGRSTISLVRKCSTCGLEQYSVSGVEEREILWDQERGIALRKHTPRRRGEGLFLQRTKLAGADLFRLEELPGAIFCTDSVKEAIEAEAFTNVGFLEMGEIV